MIPASPILATAAVGDRLPTRRHRIDQDLIARYAEVSGDHNPLHTDPAFAATTAFGRTIAHGMMTLALLSDAMRVWAGAGWLSSGTLEVTFLSPVFPEDEIAVEGVLVGRDGDTLACKVECKVGDRLIVAGETSVTMRKAPSHG